VLYYNLCFFKIYMFSNRKSIGTRGYLISTRGWCLRILIRLSSVLMLFLFCVIVKHKNTFPVVTIWNSGKKEPMNKHLNMIFLSLFLSLTSQYVNPSKNEPINGHALECGYLIPALQLMYCACICIRFNSDTFSTAMSPNYDTSNVVHKHRW
jgi:hypothetical protein